MWEETSNRGFLHNETKAALMSSPNAVTAVESIALWERERQALKELHTLFLKPEGDLNDVCNLTLCIKQTIGFSWLDPLCLPAIISQTEIRRYTWLIFLEPSSQPRMLSSLTPSQLTSPWKKKQKTGFWYSWKDRSNTCVICPTPSFSWNQVSLFFPGKFIFFPSFPLSSAEHSVKVWYSLPQSVSEMNLRDNPINQTQIRLFQGNKAHWDTKIIL